MTCYKSKKSVILFIVKINNSKGEEFSMRLQKLKKRISTLLLVALAVVTAPTFRNNQGKGPSMDDTTISNEIVTLDDDFNSGDFI